MDIFSTVPNMVWLIDEIEQDPVFARLEFKVGRYYMVWYFSAIYVVIRI